MQRGGEYIALKMHQTRGFKMHTGRDVIVLYWHAYGQTAAVCVCLSVCRKQLAENNGQGWVYFIRLYKYVGTFSRANRAPTATSKKTHSKQRWNHEHPVKPSAGLYGNRSVPAATANASWQQRPALARGFILSVRRVRTARERHI